MEVTYALTGHMLILGGVAPDEAAARKMMEKAIADGSALQKFREMCTAQDGDPRVVEDYTLMPTAKLRVEVTAPADARGYVTAVDALRCGHAVMALGGGRAAVSARIDHAVGLAELIKVGEPVEPGTRLVTIHANDPQKAARAEALVRGAITFASSAPTADKLIHDLIQ
jgi:thymidine phosphorylase